MKTDNIPEEDFESDNRHWSTWWQFTLETSGLETHNSVAIDLEI